MRGVERVGSNEGLTTSSRGEMNGEEELEKDINNLIISDIKAERIEEIDSIQISRDDTKDRTVCEGERVGNDDGLTTFSRGDIETGKKEDGDGDEEGRETDCSEIVGTDIGALADNFRSPSLSPSLSSILS